MILKDNQQQYDRESGLFLFFYKNGYSSVNNILYSKIHCPYRISLICNIGTIDNINITTI